MELGTWTGEGDGASGRVGGSDSAGIRSARPVDGSGRDSGLDGGAGRRKSSSCSSEAVEEESMNSRNQLRPQLEGQESDPSDFDLGDEVEASIESGTGRVAPERVMPIPVVGAGSVGDIVGLLFGEEGEERKRRGWKEEMAAGIVAEAVDDKLELILGGVLSRLRKQKVSGEQVVNELKQMGLKFRSQMVQFVRAKLETKE